jgi:hypothetical protein
MPEESYWETLLDVELILDWAGKTGLLQSSGPVLDLQPWHYGIRLKRKKLPC